MRRGSTSRLNHLRNRVRVGLLVALISCVQTGLAQDRILIQQPGGSRIPITGIVSDYTGREVKFRLRAGEAIRRYPRSEVFEVTTQYTAHHDRGRVLLSNGKIAEAQREFAAALDDEDRAWVRREILASQVRCALWTGDYLGAINRFLPIVESDPETFHYHLIPIAWSDDPPPPNIRFEARTWTAPSASPLSKLIGASWLLSLPDDRAECEQILKRLSRESDVRIQRLAQMQLWRVKRTSDKTLYVDDVQRNQKFLEELPLELRGGAYFVIGQMWKDLHEADRAARAFLWLPFVYDSDRWLSSHACYEAAESLRVIGDLNQALNLYGEVVFRYGDTPWGKPAESVWKSLGQPLAKSKADKD